MKTKLMSIALALVSVIALSACDVPLGQNLTLTLAGM